MPIWKNAARELLENMNREDRKVPIAVESCIPNIERLVEVLW